MVRSSLVLSFRLTLIGLGTYWATLTRVLSRPAVAIGGSVVLSPSTARFTRLKGEAQGASWMVIEVCVSPTAVPILK